MITALALAAAADPMATAAAAADGGLSLITTYGPVIGGMYLAYAIASSYVAAHHGDAWLAQGKRLAWVTSILGVAGAALQTLATGAPWTVVVMAAIAAAFKLLTPTVQPQPQAARAAQAGRVRLGVMAALGVAGIAGALVLASCATVGADVKSFKDGAVTCLKADEPAAKALGLQLVTTAAADLLAGKSLADTWTDVSTEAEAGAKAQGIPVAACAFDGVLADIQALLHPPDAVSMRVAAAAAADPLAAGRAALAAFETKHGVTSVSR